MKKLFLFAAAMLASATMMASTVFQWNYSGSSTAPTVGSVETATGGTVSFLTTNASKTYSTESVSYLSSVPEDMKSLGSKSLKNGSNNLYLSVKLADGMFLAGDTIYICGYNPWKVSSTSAFSGDLVDTLITGASKTTYEVGYAILKVDADSLILSRLTGNGTGVSAIKVGRPEGSVALPKLLTITIAGVAATIKNDTITAELPYGTDMATALAAATATYNKLGDHFTVSGNTLTVYNADGSLSKTYVLNVTASTTVSSDATLSSLIFGGKELIGTTPDTIINTKEIFYFKSIAYAAAAPTAADVTYTVNDAAATATVRMADADALANFNTALGKSFDYAIEVVVDAQDATRYIYYIGITRIAASTANTISSFALNNVFAEIDSAALTVTYYDFLNWDLAKVAVTTLSYSALATCTLKANDTIDCSAPMTVTVTSESGAARVYTLTLVQGSLTALTPDSCTEPIMNAEWSIPDWMAVVKPETAGVPYDNDYRYAANKSDSACVANGGAIRIASNGAIYISLNNCDSVVGVFSATGSRYYQVEVLNTDLKTTTGSISSKTRKEVGLGVHSDTPVVVKFSMNNANGGGTFSGLKIFGRKATDPTAIENTENESAAEKIMINGQIYIRKNGVMYNALGAIVR